MIKKAFIRYANNKAVPGSLIVRTKAPKVGTWREVPYDLCCNNNNDCMQYKNYLEVPIDSATLITPPPLILPGAGNVGDGILLLPELFTGSGQYYEWKLALEFYPGSTPYTTSGTIGVSSEVGGYPSFNVANISQNQESAWQTSSESPGTPTSQEPELLNIHLKLTWSNGTFVGGDGTMKAKIWYNIVDFG